MHERLTLHGLRVFLAGLAAVLFLGTVVELVLVGHTESPMQLVPFALCGLGLLALAVLWLRPSRAAVLVLRAVMTVITIGSLIGIGQHFSGNLEFGRETQPNAAATRLLLAALSGGSPIFAPGVLIVTAALAVAATYSAGGPHTGTGQGTTGRARGKDA